MTRRTLLWAALALLGIAATATLAWSASQIAGQRIGLDSEPLSVASGLAPAHTAASRHEPQRHARVRRSGQTDRTAAAPSTPAPASGSNLSMPSSGPTGAGGSGAAVSPGQDATAASSAPAHPSGVSSAPTASSDPASGSSAPSGTSAAAGAPSRSSGPHDENGGGSGGSAGAAAGGGGSGGSAGHRDD
jgi:hypothetical protein